MTKTKDRNDVLNLAQIASLANLNTLFAAFLASASFREAAREALKRKLSSTYASSGTYDIVTSWIKNISALGGNGFWAMSHLYNLLKEAEYQFWPPQLTEMLVAYANVAIVDPGIESIFRDLIKSLKYPTIRWDTLTELAERMKGKEFLAEYLLPEIVANDPPFPLINLLRCLRAEPIAREIMREIELRETLASEISSIDKNRYDEICDLLIEVLANSKIRDGVLNLLGKFGLLTKNLLTEIGEIPGCRNLVKRWIRERKNP